MVLSFATIRFFAVIRQTMKALSLMRCPMGMTIDLKRRVAVPAPAGEPEDSADAFAEVERDMGSCDVAFNQGDVRAMAECFDPEIVFYTQHGEHRGRQEVMRYLSRRYFKFAQTAL